MLYVFSSDCEESPVLPPPPGVSDNRQCVLCLKYGDENTNVRNLLNVTLTHVWLSLCHSKHCYMFQEGGRLLYIGQNEWTHVNCALWSAEVFEDDDGSLKNVHMAVLRGKQLVRQDTLSITSSHFIFNVYFLTDKYNLVFCVQRCEKCQKPGATVGCCLTSCTSNYHFMCARQCHCVFLEDKKVYCSKHRDLIKGEVRNFDLLRLANKFQTQL